MVSIFRFAMVSTKEPAAYLVYLPNGGEVMVDFSPDKETFEVEWFRPVEGTTEKAAPVQGGAWRSLQTPFGGDAVLHLKTHKPKEGN